MTDNTKVWLVVPCYNEEKRLDVEAFSEALHTYDWLRLCFVNDCSSDATLEVLDRINDSAGERVCVISNKENSGKAESVRAGILQGLQSSECEIFGFWDADLATPFPELEVMYTQLTADQNIVGVIASRVSMLGRKICRHSSRHYFGRFFATFASIILQVPVYDTQCGAKIFRRSFVSVVFNDKFRTGWCFDIEILLRYKFASAQSDILEKSIAEYPLREWVDVDGSKVKFSHLFSVALDMLRLFVSSRLKRFI